MRTRTKILHVALCAGVATIALWITLRPRDEGPTYEGKTLLDLIRLYAGNDPAKQQAGDAISHIGTNAIPYLLDWIQYDEPRWITHLRQTVLSRIDSAYGYSERSRRADFASYAFKALGPAADEATGKLSLLMSQSKSSDTGIRAVYALALSGRTSSLPPLVAVLTNANAPLRSSVAYALGYMGKPAQPALPVLVGCLLDKDESVVTGASSSLRKLRLDPETVVPGLIAALNDLRLKVRLSVAFSLKQYGPEARSAIPALLRALRAPEERVRVSATNAILAIQPDALPPVPAR